MVTTKRFGIFSPLFGSEPAYLDLFHLKNIHAVSKVRDCCRASSNPFPDISRLLDEANWRPHLVGATALAVLGYDRVAFGKLWSAFDAGSWVAPQLAVVAYLRDPDFPDKAKVRVLSRCPVELSRVTPMDALERHVVSGPAGSIERSAKAANSLIYLLKLQGPSGWLTTELTSPDLATLLSADCDGGASIAEEWLNSLTTALKSLAIQRH
jgi:hypothetical protein